MTEMFEVKDILLAEASGGVGSIAQSLLRDIGLSLVTSFVAVIVTWTCKALWEIKVYNWFLAKFSRTALSFAGTWISDWELDSGTTAHDTMTLRQYGHKIIGKSVYSVRANDRVVDTKTYELGGIIRNNIMSLYYVNTNRRSAGTGAVIYQLQGDGDKLEGKGFVLDVVDGKITNQEYRYSLVKDKVTEVRDG